MAIIGLMITDKGKRGFAAVMNRVNITGILIYIWVGLYTADLIFAAATGDPVLKSWTGLLFGGYGSLAASLALGYRQLCGGEYWRLLTYGLIHAGVLHLYANIWAVRRFGKEAESRIGSWRTCLILVLSYVVTGIVFTLVFKPDISFAPSVGTYALCGVWLSLKAAGPKPIRFSASETYALLLLVAVNVLGVDMLFVHSVGLFIGAAAGACYVWRKSSPLSN